MTSMRLMVCTMLIGWMASVQAATVSADLASLLNSTQTMQATFKQTTYDNHQQPIQVSYGKMALQRPGKFYWEIKKPIPQVIVANTTRLWIYDPDLEQVTIRSLHQASGETPALLLSHVDTVLDKNYVVKQLPTKADGWRWFNLTSRNRDNMFASLQMGFTNQQIHEMRLQDQLGHMTKIEFQQIKTNIHLPASLFVFKAPAHTDVIDETKKH